jgi:hypothetical protein
MKTEDEAGAASFVATVSIFNAAVSETRDGA